MKALAVVLAIASAVACSAGAPELPTRPTRFLRRSVEPYLSIHDALATDSIENVRQNAGQVATAAAGLGALAAKIDTAAVQLAAAGDIAQARDRFGVLSDAIVAYMKASGVNAPDGVRTAFCPMAQRAWLQKGDTLSNPYYGTSMPTCGEFR